MRQLLPIQETFDFFALSAREEYKPHALQRFSDRFVVTNLVRLAGATRIRGGRLAKLASRALGWVFRRPGAIRDYCSVLRADWRPQDLVWPPGTRKGAR
jgi:hypothetical protein